MSSARASSKHTPVGQHPAGRDYDSPQGIMTPPASQSPPSSQERQDTMSSKQLKAISSGGLSNAAVPASLSAKRNRLETGTTSKENAADNVVQALHESPNPRQRKSIRQAPTTPSRLGNTSQAGTPRSGFSRRATDRGELERVPKVGESTSETYAAELPGFGLRPFKSVLSQSAIDEGTRERITHFHRPRFSSAEPGGEGAVSFSPTKIRTRQLLLQAISDSSADSSTDKSQLVLKAPRASEPGDSQSSRLSKSKKKASSSTTAARRGSRLSTADASQVMPSKKFTRRSTFGRSHSWATFSTPPAKRGMRVTDDIAQPESPSDDPLLLYASQCAEWNFGSGSPSFSRSRILTDLTIADFSEVGTMTEHLIVDDGTQTADQDDNVDDAQGDHAHGSPKLLRAQSMFDAQSMAFSHDDYFDWQPGHVDESDDEDAGVFNSSAAGNIFQSTQKSLEASISNEEGGSSREDEPSSDKGDDDHQYDTSMAPVDHTKEQEESHSQQYSSGEAQDFSKFLEQDDEQQHSAAEAEDSCHSGPAEEAWQQSVSLPSSADPADHGSEDDGSDGEEAEVECDCSLSAEVSADNGEASVSQQTERSQEEQLSADSPGTSSSTGTSTTADSSETQPSVHSLQECQGSHSSDDQAHADHEQVSGVTAAHEHRGEESTATGSNVSSEDAGTSHSSQTSRSEGFDPYHEDEQQEDDDEDVAEVEHSLFVSHLDEDENWSDQESSAIGHSDGEDDVGVADMSTSPDHAPDDREAADTSMQSLAETAEADRDEGVGSASEEDSMASDDDLEVMQPAAPRRNSISTVLPEPSLLASMPLGSTPMANASGAHGKVTAMSRMLSNDSIPTHSPTRADSSAARLLMKSGEHPVIQISSLDPRAAAKAAAILKLHYQYVEEGFSHEEIDADELKKYGLSVRDLRGVVARDVSDLPIVLADEELRELERQQRRGGRMLSRAGSHRAVGTPGGSRATSKLGAFGEGGTPASVQSPHRWAVSPFAPSPQDGKSPHDHAITGKSPATPRFPGAWIPTPAKSRMLTPRMGTHHTSGRSPTRSTGRRMVGSGLSPTRLDPDPLVWEMAEWTALDRVFRQQVRSDAIRLLEGAELGSGPTSSKLDQSAIAQGSTVSNSQLQLQLSSDSLTTQKIKAHCLAVLSVDVEKVFTIFVRKHSIQDSQLTGMWSSHRFATRIAALQRRYLERVYTHYRSKHAAQDQLELIVIAHKELSDMHQPLKDAHRAAEREGVLHLNASELSLDASKIVPKHSAGPFKEPLYPKLPVEDSMDFSIGVVAGAVTMPSGSQAYLELGQLHSTPIRKAQGSQQRAPAEAPAKANIPALHEQEKGQARPRSDLRKVVLQRTFGTNVASAPQSKSESKDVGDQGSNKAVVTSSPADVSELSNTLTPAQRLRLRLDATR